MRHLLRPAYHPLDLQRRLGFPVGTRHLAGRAVAPADAYPAGGALQSRRHGLVELFPRSFGVGQHDHIPLPRRQQRPNSGLSGGPADRVQQQIDVVSVAGRVDEDDPVRPAQVIAEHLSAVQHRGLVRAGRRDQVQNQVGAQVGVGLGHALYPGDLHGQHGPGVLQGHAFRVIRGPVRVVQGQDPHRHPAQHGH